jgi:hypothetical protein
MTIASTITTEEEHKQDIGRGRLLTVVGFSLRLPFVPKFGLNIISEICKI